METVADFIFLGSKITADGECSHEIKRRLLLGRKVMTNLDSIFKSRDIGNKGPSSQGYGFSSGHVWMWELVGLWRKLSAEELMLLNCGVGEVSWQSLGLQGDPASSFWRRSAFFTVQLSHPYMTTGKTTALTRQTFVGKVMSLLFNMLSRLVTTFPRLGKL